MHFVKGKPPETQYATRPGARAKRREVALGRPGFEPGRNCAWLSLRPSQGFQVHFGGVASGAGWGDNNAIGVLSVRLGCVV
jgi:hypothetical protein